MRILTIALILVLAACGGNGGSSESEPDGGKDAGSEMVARDGGDAGWRFPDVPTDTPPMPKDWADPDDQPIQPDQVLTDADSVWTTIQAIQGHAESVDCAVPFATKSVAEELALKDLVIASPTFAYQTGGIDLDGFYVQEAGGGPWSGMLVIHPKASLPAIQEGMVVVLEGEHKEVKCLTVFDSSIVTIDAPDGPQLQPFVSTPWDLAGAENAEQFEGVLVQVNNVTVTDANPDSEDGYDFGQFEVDGALRVGNDYGLEYMSEDTDQRDVGDKFDTIVGVMTWRYGQRVLMPRKEADMLMDGETPPEPEPDTVIGPDTVEPPDTEGPDTPQPEDTIQPDTPQPEDTVQPDIDWPDSLEPDTAQPQDTVDQDIPPTAPSDIVISEIMYDPKDIADDKGEWFEIHNTTDEDIDINGWRIADDDGDMHIIFWGGPLLVPALSDS